MGHSYESFYTRKFITRKFDNTKVSRSTISHTIVIIHTDHINEGMYGRGVWLNREKWE